MDPRGSVTFGLHGSSLFFRVRYQVNKLKIISLVYVYLLVSLVSNVRFKKMLLLIIARRWEGSGSEYGSVKKGIRILGSGSVDKSY